MQIEFNKAELLFLNDLMEGHLVNCVELGVYPTPAAYELKQKLESSLRLNNELNKLNEQQS